MTAFVILYQINTNDGLEWRFHLELERMSGSFDVRFLKRSKGFTSKKAKL